MLGFRVKRWSRHGVEAIALITWSSCLGKEQWASEAMQQAGGGGDCFNNMVIVLMEREWAGDV